MRSLRILKILQLHFDDCIRRFYRQHESIKALAYEEHLKRLEEYLPVHLNSFRNEMKKLGHEAEIIVCDLETLQKQWAVENNASISPSQWRVDTILAQIETYKPEILYLQDIHCIPHFVRKRLKQYYPHLKKIVAFKGFPGAFGELADLDLIFAGTPNEYNAFTKEGLRAELVYHSFDPAALENLKSYGFPDVPTYPLSFMGYSGYGGHGIHHTKRYHQLRRLADQTDMTFWITESESASPFAKRKDIQPFTKAVPYRTNPACFGLEMLNILQRSDIVFNIHTEAISPYIGNMRMFETTGVGSCLLTDTGENVSDLFEEDREIVVYRSEEELLEKIKYLRDNPSEREKIAKAGQRRTLNDHNLQNRCERVIHELDRLFD